MARINLPDSAWADVRDDLGKAPRKLTKAVMAVQSELASLPSFAAIRKAAQAAGEDVQAAAADLSSQMAPEDIPLVMPLMERLKEAQVLALVTAWSYELPLTAEGLDDLPADAFEALANEAESRSPATSAKAALADPTPARAGSNA